VGKEVIIPEAEADADPEFRAPWNDTGSLIEDTLVRVARGGAFSVMLGRLVREMRQAYGAEDARRIVLRVIRELMPSDEVARETRLAAQGYTLSVEKTAVLGCFAGSYFMRSKQGASLTLRVDQTPIGRREREWRKFRLSALG